MGIILCAGFVYGQAPTAADFGKLDWLQGTWNRTNLKPGRSGHERWVKLSPTAWQGFGITMRGNDTAFVEKLQLVTKDGNIYYVADVPGNKGAVYFKFTAISANGFTCENPEHDFPKKISYQKEGNMIKARIEGDGKAMDYEFTRILND